MTDRLGFLGHRPSAIPSPISGIDRNAGRATPPKPNSSPRTLASTHVRKAVGFFLRVFQPTGMFDGTTLPAYTLPELSNDLCRYGFSARRAGRRSSGQAE